VAGSIELVDISGPLQAEIDELLDGSVSTAKLANDSVTSPKVAVNSVVAGDIATGAITGAELGGNAVQGDEVEKRFAGRRRCRPLLRLSHRELRCHRMRQLRGRRDRPYPGRLEHRKQPVERHPGARLRW
jgi:hypothetical protein